MIDLPLPYKIAGIALIVVIVATIGYMKGYDNANSKYISFKAEVQAQNSILEADAEKARLESERITADVSKAWAAALNHQRANPRIVRVRDTSCDPTGLRSVPSTSGITAESAEAISISSGQCETYLNDGIQDAAQLMHLQAWVKAQSEVQK